jgi:hypothetical protein
MERAQALLKDMLETYLPAQLSARESPEDYPVLSLPAPKKYLCNFDEGFTVVSAGEYPVVILLPGKTRVEYKSIRAYVEDLHELAIVCLLQDNDADKLQQKRARYAEAIREAILDNFKTADPITSAQITNISYDRTLRDEKTSAYLSSVWVIVEVRERVAY